jgi:FkbM family methyltransferase
VDNQQLCSLSGFLTQKYMDLNLCLVYSSSLKESLQIVPIYLTWALAPSRGVRTFWESKLDETSTFNQPNLESKYHKMKSKVLLSSTRKMYKALIVNTVTLNDFSFKEKIGKIDLLKVDTEGHELEVLKGATTLLKQQQIELIQIERHETGLRSTEIVLDSPEEVETFLNEFSYFKVKTIGHIFAKFYDDFYMPKSK